MWNLFPVLWIDNFLFSNKPETDTPDSRRAWNKTNSFRLFLPFPLCLHVSRNPKTYIYLWIFSNDLFIFPDFVRWLGRIHPTTARGSGAWNSRESDASDCGIKRVKYEEKWLYDSLSYTHRWDWTLPMPYVPRSYLCRGTYVILQYLILVNDWNSIAPKLPNIFRKSNHCVQNGKC